MLVERLGQLADTLQEPVRERFEKLVADRGGTVKLVEGYGLTEAVTGIMGMPLHEHRPGSIGVPFPDMLGVICEPDSREPWFMCEAHDQACLDDTLRSVEAAVDLTLEQQERERRA